MFLQMTLWKGLWLKRLQWIKHDSAGQRGVSTSTSPLWFTDASRGQNEPTAKQRSTRDILIICYISIDILSSISSDELRSFGSELPHKSGDCRADEYNIYVSALYPDEHSETTNCPQRTLTKRCQLIINNCALIKQNVWSLALWGSTFEPTTVIITHSSLQDKMSAIWLCNRQ